MKKMLPTLAAWNFILFCSASLAQPILTATGLNPVLNESYTMKASEYLSPGSAGANQTWNLNFTTGTSGGLSTFVTPSSTPNASSFPNANIALNRPSASTVVYYKTSGSAFQNHGVIGGSASTVMAYTNPEDLMHYPFAYNNTYTDNWAAVFVSGANTFYRTGTTTVTADGYGKLTTPTATYTNVMRIHFVQDYQDSTDVFGQPYVISYYNDQYMWYKEGTHFPLASVYEVTTDGGDFEGGNYLMGSSSIDPSPSFISSSNLFPNPASDKATIEFSLKENKRADVVLLNAVGQQVESTQIVDGVNGLNTVQLDVANLPEGIYMAEMIVDGMVATTKRFTVMR
jgi:hypothetical protein